MHHTNMLYAKKGIILCALLLIGAGCTTLHARGEKRQAGTYAQHPWNGRRIAYIGDSVTDPNQGVGQVTHYWQFLADWLHTTPLVYAVSGYDWTHAVGLTDKLYQDVGQDVDAIIVFLGTNDYNEDLPLGKWFTESPEQVERGKGGREFRDVRLHRTLCTDQGTLRGRINVAMRHLKSLYPTKQIVLLTPLHRGYAFFGKGNRQPSEDYRNEQGLWIDDYVEAIQEAAHVWAVPVIDLFSLSGLLPTVPSQRQYFCHEDTDQLHPNTRGHRRLAMTLLTQLAVLPCGWE